MDANSPPDALGKYGQNNVFQRNLQVFYMLLLYVSEQDLVLTFIRDIFSFQQVRYTTVEDLAEDILLKAREASETAWERLSWGI